MRSSSSRSTFRNRSATRPTTTKTPLAASVPTIQVRLLPPLPPPPPRSGPVFRRCLLPPTNGSKQTLILAGAGTRRLAVDGTSVWRALELHEQAHADRVRPGRLSLRQTVSEPKVRRGVPFFPRLDGTTVPRSNRDRGTVASQDSSRTHLHLLCPPQIPEATICADRDCQDGKEGLWCPSRCRHPSVSQRLSEP